MLRIEHANGVVTYSFDTLVGLPMRAHVSTRHGGISPAPWQTLNLSVARGDTSERVGVNRRRLAEALNIRVERQIRCQQIHGTGVAKVDEGDAGTVQTGMDALITDVPGLPLSLVFADCVPVFLYDRKQHALGVCHAGWRGTVNGAAAATLWAMVAAYDTEPANIVAGIGPSIGPASYEVGEEVVQLAKLKLPGAERFIVCPQGSGSNAYFDLWRANQIQLVEAGVPMDQIEVGGIDTASSTDDFFSHRAERGRCGLFGMVAWLEPS